MTYVDLHRQVSLDIETEIQTAIAGLVPASGTGTNKSAAKSAVTKLLRHQKLRHPLSVLPMLVHGIETGNPAPAVPLAALHVLWWTSACYLDDLADAHEPQAAPQTAPHPAPTPAPPPPSTIDRNEALLASVLSGTVLPLRIVRSLPVPASVHGLLTAEIATGWAVGIEGQLTDIATDPSRATPQSVITGYRGKSGGPYSMITAMAAILAGADASRVGHWREFGYVFGILWQIFNDQEDILSGRNEDLLNGTATYLLTCALEDSPDRAARERVLALCTAARNSGAARAELARILLSPAVLHRYRTDLEAFRADAHRILGVLGGDDRYLAVLRHLVDHAAAMLLRPAPDRQSVPEPVPARTALVQPA
ncbi:polyprenyl synthetase family protein [Streptomyces sp. NPDC059851]|uniref:polyprenyl synthetase family protein n=1 Tax=Streptomyces sp. NPDC059851 TaxID=3346971 RepID=UPI00365CBA49